MSNAVVSSVTFTGDGGVLLTYMELPDDVRNRGLLVGSHQLAISSGTPQDYQTAIEDLRAAVTALLRDALEDFRSTDPYVEPSPEDVEGEFGG